MTIQANALMRFRFGTSLNVTNRARAEQSADFEKAAVPASGTHNDKRESSGLYKRRQILMDLAAITGNA